MSRGSTSAGSCATVAATPPFASAAKEWRRTATASCRWLKPEAAGMPAPEHIDRRRAALIAYDVCRRALTPPEPARRAAMRPVLDAWVRMNAIARAAEVPVIYTTPVSRADGADVVMLPTDLSAESGVPPLTNAVEGTEG